MSIDVQEAIKAIRDMHAIMDAEEDYLTIVAAEERMIESDQKRKEELEKANAKLKALTRTLEAARISSTRPPSVPSQEEHIAMLNKLDSTKLSLAKAISDAEGMVGSKEAELAKLKEEARALEAYDPAVEHAKELDGSALRLQLYQGMGFEPIYDPDRKVAKMLIRSTSGDIHTIDFASVKSDFDYTQLLWKVANS